MCDLHAGQMVYKLLPQPLVHTGSLHADRKRRIQKNVRKTSDRVALKSLQAARLENDERGTEGTRYWKSGHTFPTLSRATEVAPAGSPTDGCDPNQAGSLPEMAA